MLLTAVIAKSVHASSSILLLIKRVGERNAAKAHVAMSRGGRPCSSHLASDVAPYFSSIA